MRRQRGGSGFLPQADRHPRTLPRGAARPLGRGGAAGAGRHQPGQPGATIIARPAGETAVDDDADVVERQAGLGNCAGQHQLARAGRWRGERGALDGGVDLAVEAVEDHVVGQRVKRGRGAFDLGDSGEKGEQRSAMIGQCAADRGGHLRFDPRGRVAPGVGGGQREALALADDHRRVAQQLAEPFAIERRRHRDQPQIGPQRCRVERQGEREVAVETALMDLVEQHRRH